MQLVLLLLAGWANALSLAWPFDSQIPSLGLVQGQALWWLQILALATLGLCLHNATSSKQIAWRTWVFSLAWLAGSIWWLYISMHTYGGLPAWLAGLAVLVLAACLALFYALFLGAFLPVAGVNSRFLAIIFASLWMLAELARGTWLTGLPWGAVGYAHVDGPLSGLAAYLGVYGMSFVAAFFAMLLAQFLAQLWGKPSGKSSPTRKSLLNQSVIVTMLVAATYLYSKTEPNAAYTHSAPLQVTLLQGNIPQNEKFIPGTGMATALSWYQEELFNATSSLVVTPETAIPLRLSQLETSYWDSISRRFHTGQQAALIGMVGSRPDGYTNAVIGLKPSAQADKALLQSKPYQYDKVHLVPFGEFFPPFAQWFIRMMNIPLGSFQRGTALQAPFEWQGERLGLNICYEDLFGEELAERFAKPETAPTILVNVTNIAWFGNSIAIDQHLNIARLRSMELAKPSIRATNTGATVIIDAQGKVTHSIARHTRGALVGEVWGNTSVTPYAWVVARFWLWPWYALGVLVLGIAWFKKR